MSFEAKRTGQGHLAGRPPFADPDDQRNLLRSLTMRSGKRTRKAKHSPKARDVLAWLVPAERVGFGQG